MSSLSNWKRKEKTLEIKNWNFIERIEYIYRQNIYTSFIRAQTHIALYILLPPKRERERERESEDTRTHTRTPFETDRPNTAIIINKVIRHAGRYSSRRQSQWRGKAGGNLHARRAVADLRVQLVGALFVVVYFFILRVCRFQSRYKVVLLLGGVFFEFFLQRAHRESDAIRKRMDIM